MNHNGVSKEVDCRVDKSLSPEIRWNVLQKRLPVGQVLEATVSRCEEFGAMIDIGQDFPGFIDVVDLPAPRPGVGESIRVKVVQFADWNHQVRLSPVSDEPASTTRSSNIHE